MSRYIVKFKKFDERVISSLVNKQVYFPTVHKLNDFGEFRFLSDINGSHEDRCLVCEKLKDPFFVADLIQGLYKNAKVCRRYIENLKVKIKLGKIEDSDFAPIIEYIAFSSVGVFSASKIDIFDDKASQLMFAHYADANRGIGLIYESKKSRDVEYNTNLSLTSFGSSGRHLDWIKGQYEDMDDFTIKDDVWKYESEVRLFNEPGLHFSDSVGLDLKRIVYTPLFETRHLATLKNINSNIYSSQLQIEEIIPSHSCSFRVEVDGKYIDIKEWLYSSKKG